MIEASRNSSPGACLKKVAILGRGCIILLLMLSASSCRKHNKNTKGATVVEVKLLRASKAKSPRDIAPYEDAISWNSYSVERIVSGDIHDAATLRVAQWTVRHGKAVAQPAGVGQVATLNLRSAELIPDIKGVAASDDLDFDAEAPRYFDMSWDLAEKAKPENQRFDYGGVFSDQMKVYWKMRPQIRLAVMGNSHATMGISPREFFDRDDIPTAVNLAPAGAHLAQQCLMVRDYLLNLPKLEWVVWVLSARSFNAALKTDTLKYNDFLSSGGYRYDQAHKASLWPVPPLAAPVTLEEMKALDLEIIDPWGWEGRRVSLLPEDVAQARPIILEQLTHPLFEFDDSAWEEFITTLASLNARGVKVLLLTTPLHPLCNEAAAIDVSGTTREGQRQMVAKAKALCAPLTLTWFRDFHDDGHHDFTHDEFRDAGHLNRDGAVKLTKRVVSWMKECAGQGK